MHSTTTARTGCDVLDAFLQELPVDEELVLIPHSNAGAYVPVLTTRRPVLGVVFVDAVLPPHRGHQRLAPPAFHEFLKQKADGGGVLPVWTDWWGKGEVAALFVDSETRTRIVPQVTAAFGVGADTAAEMVIVVGDNPDRVCSGAALANSAASP